MFGRMFCSDSKKSYYWLVLHCSLVFMWQFSKHLTSTEYGAGLLVLHVYSFTFLVCSKCSSTVWSNLLLREWLVFLWKKWSTQWSACGGLCSQVRCKGKPKSVRDTLDVSGNWEVEAIENYEVYRVEKNSFIHIVFLSGIVWSNFTSCPLVSVPIMSVIVVCNYWHYVVKQ